LKTLKRGVLLASIVLGLLLVTVAIMGNYLVNYALLRSTTAFDSSVTYESEEEKAAAEKIYEAWTEEANDAQNWQSQVKTETVQILSADNLLLKAAKIEQESKDIGEKWVILLHGYRSDKSSMLPYAEEYYKAGYNVLIPDMRSHGDSEGEYIGMGWLDKDDVLLWIRKIMKEDPYSEIILHGVSMGGATVMMTVGEPTLPYNVVAAIEDCGYTSAWDIFQVQLKSQFGLPSFPVLNVADLFARLRAGYGFKEASALRQIKRCKIPMLFIHGEDDTFVPFDMVQELYDAAICQKELVTFPGAGHAASEVTDPQGYWNAVFSFLGTYGNQ